MNANTTNANSGSGALSDLDLVQAQFDDWRSSRVGRPHIPDSLWAAAIGLLDQYPISMVSERLRLNLTRLQQRRDGDVSRASGGKRKNKRRGGQRSAAQPAADFLQLATPNATLPPGMAQASYSIIIERVDGSRLTLRLPADRQALQSLCTSFLGQ